MLRWTLAGLMCVASLGMGCARRGASPSGRPGPASAPPAARPEASPAAARDFDTHVAGLRRSLPTGFTLVPLRPFVVLGDEPAATVADRVEGTVRWAVSRLRSRFFPRELEGALEIWLLKDDASYRRLAKDRFGDTPSTPYGYYSEAHGALIMNIATGGGTLIHELVHPYVRANFPGCPIWINEGLGSLYEQSTEHEGAIWGLPNWRLPGLQKAVRAGSLLTFEKLAALEGEVFYDRGSGAHYAQARYLLLYLQERGLLVRFWHTARQSRVADPTGYRTLRSVLGDPDMVAFQRQWETWVLGLVFE
jgi:hypothetical protein